jgi:hypothetical protein
MPTPKFDEWHHCVPVPDFLTQAGLYLTSGGRYSIQRGKTYPRHPHPRLHFTWEEGRTLAEFGLVVITKGCGAFESRETGQIPVAAGQAPLFFPDIWHRYRSDCDIGWKEKCLHFDGATASEMPAQGQMPIIR